MKKKIGYLFCLCFLISGVIPVSVNAEEGLASRFKLNISDAKIDAGDQVTVTVDLNQAILKTDNITNVQGELYFDTDELTYVSHKLDSSYNDYKASYVKNKKRFQFSKTSMTNQPYECEADDVVTVVLKANKDTSAKHVKANLSLKMKVSTKNAKTVQSESSKSILICNGHEWNSGKVTKAATCAKAGVKTYACTYDGCGAAKTESMKATGKHKYSSSYKVDKKATATANGSKSKHCTVCDAKSSVKTIYKASGIKLSTASYTYNGKTKKPTVTVKDSKGNKISSSNYTLKTPSGRKNVGRYTYKITFKNEYSGTKNLTLTIKPKSTSIKSLSKAKKAFTVKWKKQSSQTTGYQIQYSTSKAFKSKDTVTKTISKNKTTKATIKKLKAKKTYYVKVRTYKNVKISGKTVKVYSDWSKVKKVKTK